MYHYAVLIKLFELIWYFPLIKIKKLTVYKVINKNEITV